MKKAQTPARAPRAFVTRLQWLQRQLIDPLAAIDDLAQRRTARLLATFLLVLIALFVVVDITRIVTTPGYRAPWYGYLLFGSAYALSRTRNYQLAAALTIGAFPLIIFTTIARNPESGLNTTVNYLVLSVFLASIFLPRRGLALLAIVNITGLALLPIALPLAIPTYTRLVTPIAVNLIGAALALIFMRHRDQIEGDRQSELRASADRLRLALEAAHMGIWDWDVSTGIVNSSEQVAPLFGLPPGAFAAPLAAYLDHIHPADRRAIEQALAASLDGENREYQVMHRVLWPDGSLHWLEEQGRVHRDRIGRPIRVTGTVIDITARKQAEAERARAEAQQLASERRFRALIDHCADAVALLDQHGVVQYISPAVTRILGYDQDIYIGEHVFKVIHPDDRQLVTEWLGQLMLQPGGLLTIELRVGHVDGSWRWFEATAVNSLGEPAIAGLVVNFHDVTERKQAEAALRDSEERYRVISELVSDYAFAYRIDPDGRAVVEWITDAFTRITGYTLADLRMAEQSAALVHPDDRLLVDQRRRQLRAGQSAVNEYRVIARDGRILWLRQYDRPLWDANAGRAVRGYGAVQDITQIKQLEQQLGQAQKMEAIGQLAGGIAHDFNNLLTVILGNTEMLLDPSTPIESLRANTEQIYDTAKRAASLTRQLLTFSRQQVLEPRPLDINAVVNDMRQLLHRLIGERIDLVTQLASNIGHVQADPGQMEQVIMNLVVNARDAMPNGGTLAIHTSSVVFDDADPHKQRGVARGRYVMLMICDTGMGMDAQTRARIFEPFFTTKAPGKGTGLGLATVQGIVAQSGGAIMVASAPNQGSTFTIYLPQVDQADDSSATPDHQAAMPFAEAKEKLSNSPRFMPA
jgi:PAS domain S-box-containing protein